MTFNVGDVVMRTDGNFPIKEMIGVVVEVRADRITICDGTNKDTELGYRDLKLIDKYTSVLQTFTQKGVELVARVQKR